MSAHWRDIVAEKRARQLAAIPKEWLISPPSNTVKDVTRIPDDFLSPREKEITNTIDVAVLLAKLASAEWSSLEVTTAFYKRAIIAQQVVSNFVAILLCTTRDTRPGELLDRNLRRACSCSSKLLSAFQ